jgi:transcriptional regulator with PAS, ATPase and Fis domain
MNTLDRSILIVSLRKKPAIFLEEQLLCVLSNEVIIHTHSFFEDGPLIIPVLPTIVLASGDRSFEEALKTIPEEKIILAKRFIGMPNTFPQLFLLPKGKKVFVICETPESTQDTIQNLIECGFDYLDFKPYWKDCDRDDEDIDTAVSTEMFHFHPRKFKTEIDIGTRMLSITVFIQILNKLNIDISYAEKYVSLNRLLLINAYRRLSILHARTKKLTLLQESILNNIDEAIISVEESRITECNPTAETILGLVKNEILGRDIREIISDISKTAVNDNPSAGTVLFLNGKSLFTSFIPLQSDNNMTGLYTFKETGKIEKIEENIRIMLHKSNTGYSAKYTFDDIITESDNMRQLINSAQVLAQHDSSILITGDSGTGKEMFAQSIHNASPRKSRPFVAVNFAALPDNLIESELFGYSEGAFTGAKKAGKKGFFELAHNGTIFLDEIGDSSLWTQSRLLRVLEEKEIMRLGDTKITPVNVRIIAATNQNLRKLVDEGKFRADLYYRINVFHLYIPPLRDRKESIAKLLEIFFKKYNIHKTLSDAALNFVLKYYWPGNLREFRNMIEYISLMSKSSIIHPGDLPYDIVSFKPNTFGGPKSEIDKIYYQIKELFNIEHLKAIMEIINSNKYNIKKIGRASMISVLMNYDVNITVGSLRTILSHLQNHGLIIIGKTKQGTQLSSKGEAFLKLISESPNNSDR